MGVVGGSLLKRRHTKDASWPENKLFRKCANISIGRLHLMIPAIFVHKKYCSASNLSATSCRHVVTVSLFTSEEQNRFVSFKFL